MRLSDDAIASCAIAGMVATSYNLKMQYAADTITKQAAVKLACYKAAATNPVIQCVAAKHNISDATVNSYITGINLW